MTTENGKHTTGLTMGAPRLGALQIHNENYRR
jgi:hypothetical protein